MLSSMVRGSITSLRPNQVFVFGSNSSGFHGAYAAGLACRGDSRNTWRLDAWFLAALKTPVGDPVRVGKWAVLGTARGFQVGREGMSYAIETITEAGALRSVPRSEIQKQLVELFRFCTDRPDLEFLMTAIGIGGAGYTRPEMSDTLSAALSEHGRIPPNFVIPPDLY